MKTYILHWLDGNVQEIRGTSIADAFMRAGYGGGAIAALDYYEEKRDDYRNKKCGYNQKQKLLSKTRAQA